MLGRNEALWARGSFSRRKFIETSAAFAAVGLPIAGASGSRAFESFLAGDDRQADYALHIKNSAIEIAPKRIISAVTYNRQFPGPLLRFREGRAATVDILNDTDTPEQRNGVSNDGSAGTSDLSSKAGQAKSDQ